MNAAAARPGGILYWFLPHSKPNSEDSSLQMNKTREKVTN